MGDNLIYKNFGEININDLFFDSLKGDYDEFKDWFNKKKNEKAYVHYKDNGHIDGFLYYKLEQQVSDVSPSIAGNCIVKIGTLKINPHGTKLGERFLKLALDFAIKHNADHCYLTIFDKQDTLINLVKRYGFVKYGIKTSGNGNEEVYLKDMKNDNKDICLNYPRISLYNKPKYLLSIYPQYHSKMFLDSILCNESRDILEDVAYTNSIHKHYVCSMFSARNLKKGDILVIYKTKDENSSAEYNSVATSICTVEEIHFQEEFSDFEAFYKYACKYSIFDKDELLKWYKKGNCLIIKMLYNVALKRRITRHDLIGKVGLSRGNGYWGCKLISDNQLEQIIKLGGVNESIIIN